MQGLVLIILQLFRKFQNYNYIFIVIIIITLFSTFEPFWARALGDFTAQEEGDLTFRVLFLLMIKFYNQLQKKTFLIIQLKTI
jgi:hypothetical protein